MSTTPDTPTSPSQRPTHCATVVRVVDVAPDTRALHLQLPPETRFRFSPGQFVSCLLPVGGADLVRAYTIASHPEDVPAIEVVWNRVPNGQGSHYLFGLGVGDTLRFTGPWGTFTLDQAPAAECVFIAEGTAIAPIRPMLRRALDTGSGHAVRLHYAAPRPEALLYDAEFRAAATAHPRFTYEPLLGEHLFAHIERRYVLADDDRTRHFYVCAVGDIAHRLRDLLRAAGYARRAVQYEKW